MLPSERIKKKKRQERKKQADCLNHRLPSVSEAHRHTLCTNIWSYPQTHRYSSPSPLPLLPSLLTRVVCGLCIVSTDTIACLGTRSSQCWHRHTGGCAHHSPSQDGNNAVRGSKKTILLSCVSTTWHFQWDSKSRKLEKLSPNTRSVSCHSCFLDKHHCPGRKGEEHGSQRNWFPSEFRQGSGRAGIKRLDPYFFIHSFSALQGKLPAPSTIWKQIWSSAGHCGHPKVTAHPDRWQMPQAAAGAVSRRAQEFCQCPGQFQIHKASFIPQFLPLYTSF